MRILSTNLAPKRIAILLILTGMVVLRPSPASALARGFGDSAAPMRVGNIDGNGKDDVFFYGGSDHTWWVGLSDGVRFDFRQFAQTPGFGDNSHDTIEVGDFAGGREADVFLYGFFDQTWWVGVSNGNTFEFQLMAQPPFPCP